MLVTKKPCMALAALCLMVFKIAAAVSCLLANQERRNRPLVQSLTSPVEHGEGPFWDSDRNALFFVSIIENKVFRYDPVTGRITYADVGAPVGVFIPIRGTKNKFIIGRSTQLSVLTWNGENTSSPHIQVLDTIDIGKDGNRFNDGKADPSGRFFVGTMGYEDEKTGYIPPNQGTLYRTSSNSCKLEAVLPNVTVSNGLIWSLDNRVMYYIDSGPKTIYRFDYDILTGSISNKKVLLNFDEAKIQGVPDGMTIDNNGNLWVACYNGSQVICINSTTGEVIYSIHMPVELVSSLTFGGPYFDILYVTTIRRGLTSDKLARQPLAGALFSITGIPSINNLPVVGRHNDPVGNCAPSQITSQ